MKFSAGRPWHPRLACESRVPLARSVRQRAEGGCRLRRLPGTMARQARRKAASDMPEWRYACASAECCGCCRESMCSAHTTCPLCNVKAGGTAPRETRVLIVAVHHPLSVLVWCPCCVATPPRAAVLRAVSHTHASCVVCSGAVFVLSRQV